MKMYLILEYCFGGRFYQDLLSLLRHFKRPYPDVLFAAGSQVDLQWVILAYESSIKQGLRCAFVGPDLLVPQGADYYDTSMHMLRFYRAPLFVTATSGLTLARMPRSSVRRVAILHSLVSLHMAYPVGTFNGYTDIFCCGQHHVDEIEAMNSYYNIANRRPVLIGYGKLARLSTIQSIASESEVAGRHVLIGPSWGAGNILEAIGGVLIARLLAEGYQVTLRPHPSFFIIGDRLIDSLVATYIGQPAFRLESSIQESTALWTADFMISDYSGLAMEFALMRGKPVLYVNVPPKVLNPEWGVLGLAPLELSVREHIGVLVPPEVDAVIAGLARLRNDPARWAVGITQVRERHWTNFGHFGEVCAEQFLLMLDEVQQSENIRPKAQR